MGLTFKEYCPDTRNSKIEDIINRLTEYEIKPIVVDPWASEYDAMHEYGITLTKLEEVSEVDCVILAVAHDEFRNLSLDDLDKLYAEGDNKSKVLIDVKSVLNRKEVYGAGYRYWRL